ncbi:hypothetical protein [Cytobacillus gottheilii]|uniref:hypothetical protein n=1 Tax=Cytobacillus gottheilii TaxID=859144 RepID=UPI0009BBA30E|nr:hypothetical protein [Cytobacillus gottheilii]
MKKKYLIGLGVLLVLLAAITYWYFFADPSSMPADEQLVKEINSIYPQADAAVIQDTIFIDERNVLVPFISNKENYGFTSWTWHNKKWTINSVNTKGDPMLWKTNPNDPSSYRFIWNIHPDDQLGSIDLFLIRDRGYRMTDGIEFYDPKVQMKETVSLGDESYGIVELPPEWTAFMNPFIEVEMAKQSTITSSFYSEMYMYFGWIAYDAEREEAVPERSFGGNGTYGGVELEYIRRMQRQDIEIPKD